MIESAYIFRTAQTIPGVFDSLFAGIFVIKGVPLAAQLAVLALVPAAISLLILSHRTGNRTPARIAEGFGYLTFTLLAIFCLQPWDEVFINLRHAQHWAELGRFSFNAYQLSEGTVDFLPYFLIGVLHRCGLPLVELAFAMSWLGGVFCLLAARRLFVGQRLAPYRSVFLVGLCTFATLLFNASNGFANTFFAAAILWSIVDLFYDGKRGRGWLLLALLPLLRLEGAWFSLLLAISARPGLLLAGTLTLPTLALSYYRWRVFGSAIPAPIVYKAGLGNFFLTVVGLRNLLADLIASGTGVALFVLSLTGVRDPRQKKLLAILALGCLPYYSSGGDWFPSYWGRYLLPFTLFVVIAAASELFRAPIRQRRLCYGSALGVFLLHLAWPISSYYKLGELFFAHRRTMARIQEPTIARGHYRVQHLSQLGWHLRNTTRPEQVIGSSEIATIMYFANRDALDLLGVTNREIADAPLREFPSLLRRFPDRSELPYLIFKRLRPDLLARYLPPFLYTFDFMMRDLVEGLPHDEITDADLFLGLRRWQKKLGGLVDALYGGTDAILKLGYQPVIVSYSNGFLSLYFVSAPALHEHLNALYAAGFTGGLVKYIHPAGPSAVKMAEPRE